MEGEEREGQDEVPIVGGGCTDVRNNGNFRQGYLLLRADPR